MAIDGDISGAARSEVLARLRTLRETFKVARELLVHYKADRTDRDKLEPAARRVDALMDMFVDDLYDPAKAARWVTEILDGVEHVANPKVVGPLEAARAEVPLLLEAIGKCVPAVKR